MNRFVSASPICLLVALNAAMLGACNADPGTPPEGSSSGSAGTSGVAASGDGEISGTSGNTTGASGSGATGSASTGADTSGSGTTGAGGAGSTGSDTGSSGGGSGITGSTGDGSGSTGSVASGVSSGSAAGDVDGSVGTSGVDSSPTEDAGKGTSGGGSDAAENPDIVVPSGCTLPSPVSFQKDVQPFLTSSCSGAGGCHVTDASSTVANGGYTHAYDWITGTAHASSCPEMPTPYRFQVVIAVVEAANPPSCSKATIMPPANAVEKPLTACQIATLEAWLAEPFVTQKHRVDGISPLTPYAMPPFN